MGKRVIIVVDMLKDYVALHAHSSIWEEGRKIIPNLSRLLSAARQASIPVIFANDSFMPHDFIFQGKVKPHAIRGTQGAEVIEELEPQPGDMVLEKRRFSAFFKTDLDITLRSLGIDTIVVTGITTECCVLTTLLDGMANDFKVILVEDCCASSLKDNHNAIIKIFGNLTIQPLLDVLTLDELLSEIGFTKPGAEG